MPNNSFFRCLTTISTLSLTLLLPSLAHAHDVAQDHKNETKKAQPESSKSPWSGKLSVSLKSNVGNTNTRKIKLSGNIVYNKQFNAKKPIKHALSASINTGSRTNKRGGDRIKTREQESAGYKLEYFLNDKSLVRAFTFYESDTLAKMDSLLVTGVGYERKLLNTKKHKIKSSLAVSDLEIKYSDGTPTISGTAVRAAVAYKGKLTDSVTYKHELMGVGTNELTMTRSNAALEYAFNKRSSVSLNNRVTHFSKVAQTATDKTDSTTGLSLNFKF